MFTLVRKTYFFLSIKDCHTSNNFRNFWEKNLVLKLTEFVLYYLKCIYNYNLKGVGSIKISHFWCGAGKLSDLCLGCGKPWELMVGAIG